MAPFRNLTCSRNGAIVPFPVLAGFGHPHLLLELAAPDAHGAHLLAVGALALGPEAVAADVLLADRRWKRRQLPSSQISSRTTNAPPSSGGKDSGIARAIVLRRSLALFIPQTSTLVTVHGLAVFLPNFQENNTFHAPLRCERKQSSGLTVISSASVIT